MTNSLEIHYGNSYRLNEFHPVLVIKMLCDTLLQVVQLLMQVNGKTVFVKKLASLNVLFYETVLMPLLS